VFRAGRAWIAFIVLVTCLGCGRSPATPSSTPVTSATGAAPIAAVAITIDSTGAREAIAAVSDVAVDASASTGSGLRYRIDFGDGASNSDRVARHIYQAGGTYKVTVTVTDDAARTATASTDVMVGSAVGRWVHAGYFARANRVGVWALRITAQDGTAVRGVLTEDNADRGTLTGSIGTDRRVRFVLDGSGESLEGVIPSVFAAEGAGLGLTMRGGSSSGEALTFKRIVGDPVGPPPDAVLKMRFFSFGAPFAVKQISPVLFDGSTSRGDGLSYFIEFGDGQVTTSASATHPLENAGLHTARLTVVDRFGRSNSETTEFFAYSLVTPSVSRWDTRDTSPRCDCFMRLRFVTQEGSSVTGRINFAGPEIQFAGTVSADGGVRLMQVGGNITLSGTLTMPHSDLTNIQDILVLTWHGGQYDGVTMSLRYDTM
jgi:PKD repeat protein